MIFDPVLIASRLLNHETRRTVSANEKREEMIREKFKTNLRPGLIPFDAKGVGLDRRSRQGIRSVA